MASGKTTLGRPLAEALCRPFVDLDAAVEADAGMSVAEIFATRGEAAFRELETKALHAAAAEGAVVSCGGGTPCREENMEFMLASGTVVELRAAMPVILRRLRLAPGQRPLIDALLDKPAALEAKVSAMMEARKPFYSRAHRTFASDRLESEQEIKESVAQFINQIIVNTNLCQ